MDFGCGPGPLLANMLREHGYQVRLYDPFYANDVDCLMQRYDFITCTEVVEHLRQPKQEFERLFALLQPYGILAVMTKLVIDAEAFAKWHYKNDPTHICFYSRESLQWLAYRYQKMVEFIGNDVIIFSGQA